MGNWIKAGWKCRTWTETTEGWRSGIHTFSTEEEAHEFGQRFVDGIRGRDLQREYKVYVNWVQRN